MDALTPQTIQGRDWRAYTADTSEQDARAAYTAWAHVQPEVVGRDQWGKVLAGPVVSAIDDPAGI